MSDSGSEYLPSEDEEEEQETAEEEEEWGTRRPGGADDGYTTGGTTGSEYEDDDLFDAEAGEEPFALLESLNKQQVESQSMGAYQLLRNKRGRGRPRKDGGAPKAGQWHGGDDGPAEKAARRKRRTRGRRNLIKGKPTREIPEEASRMLGQANLLYANNRQQEAVELLTEVVRMVPNLSEPYHTLGLLYEDLGDPRKALDFHMIAAHMTPKETRLWRQLAKLSIELGFHRQAIYCLTKVLHRDKTDVETMMTRASLYAEIGEHARALTQFDMLHKLQPDNAEVPKEQARIHHNLGAPQRAIEVLERHLSEHPSTTDLTHINILAQLYLQQGQNHQALLLIQRASAVLCGDEPLPLDLSIKAGLAHLALGSFQEAAGEFELLLSCPADEYHDLYLEVISAYTSSGQHERAVPYLAALQDLPDFDTTELWSQLAACYCRAGVPAQAAALYHEKLQRIGLQDPQYFPAALSLAELTHLQLQDADAAAAVLARLDDALSRQELALPADGASQMSLFLRKTQLHLALGDAASCADSLLPLVQAALEALELRAAEAAATAAAMPSAAAEAALPPQLRRALKRRRMMQDRGKQLNANNEMVSVFKGYKTHDRRKPHVRAADMAAEEYLRQQEAERAAAAAAAGAAGASAGGSEVPAAAGEAADAGAGGGDEGEGLGEELFSKSENFDAFAALIRALLALNRTEEAAWLLQRASKLVGGTTPGSGGRGPAWHVRDELHLLQAEVLCRTGEYVDAVRHVKAVCNRWPYSWAAWNLFCAAQCRAGGGIKQWAKFVGALRAKHPGSLALTALQGHVSALSGNYSQAIHNYSLLLRHLRHEPLPLLCSAVAHINAAGMRNAADPNSSAVTGFALLSEYGRKREEKAEVAYNTGRAAHQLGLLHIAMANYEKCLALGSKGDRQATSLAPEAAHNLAHIYRSSGADDMARRVMREWRTV